MSKESLQVPLWEKYMLTIEEASVYFNIGQKRMRSIVQLYKDSPNTFAVEAGAKVLINRKKFEYFLDSTTCV